MYTVYIVKYTVMTVVSYYRGVSLEHDIILHRHIFTSIHFYCVTTASLGAWRLLKVTDPGFFQTPFPEGSNLVVEQSCSLAFVNR